MQLVQWQHPVNKTIRLYVNGFFAGEHADTKAWFEASDRSKSGYSLKTKGSYQGVAVSNAELKKLILMELDLSVDASWPELLSQATKNTSAIKKAAKTYGKGPVAPLAAGGRSQEALNLSIPSIKMNASITIYVDHREPQELVALLDEHPDITVVASTGLELGDFMAEDHEGNRLLIERKRCDDAHTKTDFEVSIQDDGRLFDQSERLKFAAADADRQVIPVFILEGNVYENAASMLCQSIDGAISFLSAVQRVSVIPTYNMNHTAYVVAKLASHFIDGLYTPVSLHKTKPKVLFDQQRYLLQAMPGISCAMAEVLLETFGSVRRVMMASEKELLAVPKLGKKKVADLLRVLDGV